MSQLPVPAKADPGLTLDQMRQFVRDHFEDFVNRKKPEAALTNLSDDFLDHDEPYGESVGNQVAKKMMEGVYRKMPDIHVSVEDAIAEGDKVMVRNIWHFTDPATNKPMEFHGFVLWRFANGKIVERWATITPAKERAPGS
jgi:predicted SnoaL-like aldol condensation-catalyzing enzyme